MTDRDIYNDGHGFRPFPAARKDTMTKPKAKPVVELRKQGSGYYFVAVDGVIWGSITREPRGVHGSVYNLLNGRGGRVFRDRTGKSKGKIEVTIWSDKWWLKGLGYYGASAVDNAKAAGVYKTLEARLVEAISAVIKSGDFKSPAQLEAEAKAKADKTRRAEEARQAEVDAEFAAKADEAIGEMASRWREAGDIDDLRTRIVAAMKWAQSN